MIIEEEKKVEIIEDKTKEEEFKNIPNNETHSSKRYLIALGDFFIVYWGIICLIFGSITYYNYQNNSIIAKGIYINNIDVSGLTKSEAKNKLVKIYQDKLSNDITLKHNDFSAYVKTSEIELSYDLDSAINYAYEIGKSSNIFKDNYKVFTTLVTGLNITPTYTFNHENLIKILNETSKTLPDSVVESGYYIDGNNLIVTKGTSGYEVNAEATAKEIEEKFNDLNFLNEAINLVVTKVSPKEINVEAIYNEIHKDPKDAYYTKDPYEVHPSENGIDFKISLDEAKNLVLSSEKECTIPLKVLYPNVTTNMIGQEAFPDLLATFSTHYVSNAARTTNLRLAANKINGYVLLPGKTFSYNTVVGERTIAAGYKEAAVYENGQVVQGLGGGICQISSTLFNAVLLSNLQIVELHNHQFVPSYVKAGRDATVVYGVKDFQFKNSRKHALKITCSVAKGIAKFDIWGVKEENEYDVNVYSNVTSRTSSYIKSSTYRTLKQNGAVIKNENIANFTYKVH